MKQYASDERARAEKNFRHLSEVLDKLLSHRAQVVKPIQSLQSNEFDLATHQNGD